MPNGYQITFFSHQDRRFKGKQIGDWLMKLVAGTATARRHFALGRREFRPRRPRPFGAFF